MYNLVDRYLQAAKNKDINALDGIFTNDAVYIEISGATYSGIGQIKEWFKQRADKGNVAAWDIRKIIQNGENGAAQWYYEYRTEAGDATSYDGVSLIEISDGKIKRWSEFSQTANKTYPFQ